MIRTKRDLEFFLAADKFALGKTRRFPLPWSIGDLNWKYQVLLRKSAYYFNNKDDCSLLDSVLYQYYRYKKRRLGIRLGFLVGDNAFGPGLRINHHGNLIVSGRKNSGKINIGMWCDIHQGINIGNNNSPDKSLDVFDRRVPTIGKNVWIGPGVKMFGKITIGNGVTIGANAVVTKDFPDNVTIVGVPARILKEEGTDAVDLSANPARTEKFWKEHPQFADYKEIYDS